MILTKDFAKVLGFWIVLTVLSLIAHREATIALMETLFTNPPLMFVTGVFTLLVGLAIVVAHNRWTGGAAAVLVTLYGWIALLKGLSFLVFSPQQEYEFYQVLHFPERFYAYFVFSLAIGGYLIYAGVKRAPSGDSLAR
jgi:vacuolar-type H+-ATPase subunit I/STV1